MPKKLPRDFYTGSGTLDTVRSLLGKLLVVRGGTGERVSGRIVEVEAYLGTEDKAAHSYGGRRTGRTEVMFREGGVAYVFFVYGMYHQFNIVLGAENLPHVALVRAVEPVESIGRMRERRGKMADTNLTSGPGKLCIALGIDKSFYGEDLTGNRVWLEDAPAVGKPETIAGPRIGIDYAEEYAAKPWRFWIAGNPFVSRNPRPKRPA